MAESEYRRLSCGSCGGDFLRLNQVGRIPKVCAPCIQSGQNPKAQLHKPCAYCGSPIYALKKSVLEKTQFCSRSCRGKSQKAQPTSTCEECGIGFHRRKGGADRQYGREPRFCSHKCCGLWKSRTRLDQFADKREAKEKEKAVRELARALRRLASGKELAASMVCVCGTCGKQYERRKGEHSKRCQPCAVQAKKESKRAYAAAYKRSPHGRARKLRDKALRRAKHAAVGADAIDPIMVFERDKWKCQLCGVRTPKNLRGGYDLRAPEVDHVVTFGEGGSHTWANVQCACRGCNLRKGSKSRGQMGLGFS